MKILILTTILAGSLSGCMTETTRTITTDKAGTVTDTTVVKKGTDKATMELIGMAVEIYRPRPAVIVREEKSGKVTVEEIEARWKPLATTPERSPIN
jgi:hypothetical protein